jgi:hypothetical protein
MSSVWMMIAVNVMAYAVQVASGSDRRNIVSLTATVSTVTSASAAEMSAIVTACVTPGRGPRARGRTSKCGTETKHAKEARYFNQGSFCPHLLDDHVGDPVVG